MLERFARVALSQENDLRAATLLAASESIRIAAGFALSADEYRHEVEEFGAALESRLAQAFADGGRMTVDEIVELALDDMPAPRWISSSI